jgi:PAS domain S-box-containing protein
MTLKFDIDDEVGDFTSRESIDKGENTSTLSRVGEYCCAPDQSFMGLAGLLSEIVFLTDLEGNLIFLNDAGLQAFYTYPPDLSTGIKPESFFVPEYRERLRCIVERCLDGLPEESSESKILMKDGHERPVTVKGKPIFMNGRYIGSIGVVIDLTYRKEFESRIEIAENKYRNILENISDFWYIHDLEGNFKETNFAFKKELKITEKDLECLKISDLVPEKDKPEVEHYLQEVQKKGKSSGVIRVTAKDGSKRIYEYKSSLVNDQNGPIAIQGSAWDITDRIKVQMALKASQERYRSVFENTGLPTVIIEDDMTISMVNAKFVEMTGCGRSDVQGRVTFLEFFEEEERSRVMDCFHGLKSNSPAEFESRITHRDGEKYDVIVRLGTMMKTSQVIASFLDITARKQAEAALRESREHLQKENIYLRSSIKERYRFGDIIGKSPSMQEVYEFILKAAANPANVIIYGESGTGKELVARAIHEMSDRSVRKFVTVNCGAIPENILESEFFGYKKGAFTGAHANKPGYLDYADGGTLFLDEVGEIGLSMQVKLLRAIEGGGYMPVGSNQIKNSDVRIVAATNRNLKELVKHGQMREDFFYRIHILPIYMPSLRERKEDLPLLIDHFMHMQNKHHPPLTGKVMEALHAYDWPGNVRELQNVLHRFLTLKKLDFMGNLPIDKDQIDPLINQEDTGESGIQSTMETLEKKLIQKILFRHRWHRGRTAQALGINRKTLFMKMKKYGLVKP